MKVSVAWFRDDLRVADNPALLAACSEGNTVAMYILDEVSADIRPLGGASKWWLHHALIDLREQLDELGIPLLLRRGSAQSVMEQIAPKASGVFWNRRYGGGERMVDAAIKERLGAGGVHVESSQGSLLHEPWKLRTGAGNPYQVFTPFWNSLSQQDFRAPLEKPDAGSGVPLAALAAANITTEKLDDWELLPNNPDWSGGLAATWTPSAEAAEEALAEFLAERVIDYDEARDRPAVTGTSKISPYLRWGQLSPFQVMSAIAEHRSAEPGSSGGGIATFAKEVGWREFCWHQLYHHPDLATRNLRPQFDSYPWWEPNDGDVESVMNGLSSASPRAWLAAWQRGETGIPLVDAGQRELWRTGYMHNRVRMISASFLIKNLGIHWRVGEAWFWDTLVDADAASNPANWQWVAGSGADASPFFRIFNPETQLKKFDPEGRYVNKWVPDRMMPGYPEPLVDLKESRLRALEKLEISKSHRLIK